MTTLTTTSVTNSTAAVESRPLSRPALVAGFAAAAATTSIAVPEDIWEYWLSVSRGTNGDYDERGNRVAEE